MPDDRRLRIGVVVNSDVDGGGEAYLRRLYGELRDRGHQVVLFGGIPGWSLEAVDTKVRGKWSRRHAVRRLLRTPFDVMATESAVRAEHCRQRFDVFHMQYKREQLCLSRRLARLAPVVWTEHGRLPTRRGAGLLKRWYARASAHISAIMCVSEAVSGDVSRLAACAVCVVPNAIDTDRHRPTTAPSKAAARRKLDIDESATVLLTLSRLHPDKRIELALASLDHLPVGSLLLVCGVGPDETRLQNHALNRNGRFIGRVDDVRPVLDAADVLVLPSSASAREGLPLSVLEAAAHGLPCVTTDDSGVGSVVVESGGVMTRPTASALAAGITSAVAADRREPLLRWARQHGVDSWVAEHEAVFRSAAPSIAGEHVERGNRR